LQIEGCAEVPLAHRLQFRKITEFTKTMISHLFQQSTVPVLEQVVNFAQERHGVLAGNIANIDTPGYKTRDLSPEMFEDRLRQAIEARDNKTSGGSLTSAGRIDPLQHVGESLQDILYHDESDVSLEKQVTELAKNQGMHNMAIGIMTSQFRLLEAAISERA
jgi:flagellar basal-body rod protein FlgB